MIPPPGWHGRQTTITQDKFCIAIPSANQLHCVSKKHHSLDSKLVKDVMGNYISVPLVGIRVPEPYHHRAFHKATPLAGPLPH